MYTYIASIALIIAHDTFEPKKLLEKSSEWYEDYTKPARYKTKTNQQLFLQDLPLTIRKKINEYAFNDKQTIHQYRSRLAYLSAQAYQDCLHYPQGTEESIVAYAKRVLDPTNINTMHDLNVWLTLGPNMQEIQEKHDLFDCMEKVTQPQATKMIRLFLDNGANANKISSRSGRAAIHQAVVTNNISAMRLLIMHGANINTKTKEARNYGFSSTEGMTALDFALATKNKRAISMLQRAGGLTAQQLQQKEDVA